MTAGESLQTTEQTTRPRRRFAWPGDGWWLLAIVLVALALRIVYVIQLRSSPFYGREDMDPLYHHQWAQAFAAGETFIKGPYFRAPLYPWFLGVIYWLFGPGALAPRLIQAVLGALSCGLLFLVGRRAFSRTVGILAGFAAASYWVLLYFDAELLIPVLIVFLDLLLILLLLRAHDRPTWWRWLLSGFVLGLSALARPNILLFAPAVIVWLIVIHRAHWRRALACAACLLVGCVLTILPVTVRNYVVGHDLVLISSQAGVNFYIGNNPESDGMSAVVPGTPLGWWEGYYAAIAQAEQAVGRKLKPSEVSRYYWARGIEFMADRPAQAAKLMLKKLGYFWTRWEISNNRDIRFVTSTYTPIVKYLPLGFWIIGPLGVLGLVLSLGEARRLFPLWGFVIVYVAGVVVFFVTARYRVPAVVVLILLSSHALCWLAGAIWQRRWLPLALAALVLLPVSLVVAHVPPNVDLNMAQGFCEAGLALAHQERWAEAETLLGESVERWPGNPKAWYSLGCVLYAEQDLVRAEQCFNRTLQIAPDYLQARLNLGAILATQMKLDEAIEQFELVLHSQPDHPGALANLGAALVYRGRVEAGVRRLQQAIRIDPESTAVLIRTTSLLRKRGRWADAIRVLRGGLECRPDDVQMLVPLSRLLATCRREDLRDGPEAVRLADRACQLTNQQQPRPLGALAAARFSTGQPEEAARLAQQALDLAVAQQERQLAARLRAELARYRQQASAP